MKIQCASCDLKFKRKIIFYPVKHIPKQHTIGFSVIYDRRKYIQLLGGIKPDNECWINKNGCWKHPLVFCPSCEEIQAIIKDILD